MTDNQNQRGDSAPPVFAGGAIGLTLALLAVLLLGDWLFPAWFVGLLAKDGAAGGVGGAFENLTVVVLIPGIAAGTVAWLRYRHRLPHPGLGWWLLLWSLACLYFAGEEASWGQWYFRWSTPEVMQGLNDQGETNLHNMSSWLDQKPRAVVELFIVLAGVIVPLWRLRTGRSSLLGGKLMARCEPWLAAPGTLLPAGLLFAGVKVCGWLPKAIVRDLSNSELHEFLIAWFLAWYLASYWVRLRGSESGSSAETRDPGACADHFAGFGA